VIMGRNMTFGFPILSVPQVYVADSWVLNTGPRHSKIGYSLVLAAIQMARLLSCTGRIGNINSQSLWETMTTLQPSD
jgi:hypothetical protein